MIDRSRRLSPKAISGAQIEDGFRAAAERVAGSRQRITTCRMIEDGLLRMDSEREYDRSRWDHDPLLPLLPQRTTLTRAAANRYGGARPYCTRAAHGGTIAAGEAADEAERYINAALNLTYDYEASVGLAIEGEFALAVVPTPADWRRVPDLIDLHRPAPRGARRARRSRDERSAYLATRPPWTCRLISATDCAPVLVRGRGPKRYEVAQLYVRTLYDIDELVSAGYIFDTRRAEQLVPRGFDPRAGGGANGQVYLYEMFGWLADESDSSVGMVPVVAYSVAGLETRRAGYSSRDDEAVVINLREEYGLSDLPVGYFYGLHRERDEPSERGIPYLWPLVDWIVASEATRGAIGIATWENAYTGHVASLPPGTTAEGLLEGASDGQLRFRKPGYDEILVTPGPTEPFKQASVGRDAWQVLQSDLMVLRQNSPADELAGGGSLPSGRAGTVMDELDKAAARQIPESCRRAYEFAGERIAELLCTLARGEWRVLEGAGVAAPLYVNVPGEPDPGGTPAERRQIIEFRERWFGAVYDMQAEFPRLGNLAEVQQELGLWEKGAATLDDVLEKRGKTSTTLEKAKIVAEKLLISTPEGQAEMLEAAYRWRGETEKADAIKRQREGAVAPGGTPVAALKPPVQAPPAPGAPGAGTPGPAGTQLPNVAASSLGGITAGAIGQAALMSEARARIEAQSPPAPPAGSGA